MKLSFKFNRAWRRELAPGDRRLWLLRCIALRIERAAVPVWRIELFHRRLLLALGGLGLGSYLALVTAGWWWWQRNPHNRVSWGDVALAPVRWEKFRERRGDTAIETARAKLKEGDYVETFHLLRAGLSRSPANTGGRTLLAQLLAGYEPQRAIALMEEGIPHSAADRQFLAVLFALYARFQMQQHALEQAGGILDRPPAPLPDGTRFFLLQTRAALLSRLGRHDEALAVLADVRPVAGDTEAALRYRQLEVDVLLRAGRPAQAREVFTGHLAAAPVAPERLQQEGEIAVALVDAAALESVLRRWRARAPEQPAPYLYAFNAWHRLKRPTFRDAAERDYYRLFGRNDAAMQTFAAMLVNLALPDTIERARRVAQGNRLSAFAFRVHLTEIALRRGGFENAVRHLRDWESAVETLKPAQRFYPEFIKRLARAAFAGTDAQAEALVGHLAANRGQAQLPVWLLAVRTMEQAGQPAAMEKLLRAALVPYPGTDELLAARERLEQQRAAAPVAAAPEKVLAPATAAAALARLDELLGNDRLGEARDLLRTVRAARPAWMDSAEPELAAREIELALATMDPLTSRSLVRAYLDRHRSEDDALRLAALARRLAEAQRPGSARLIADELASRPQTGKLRTALAGLNLPDDQAEHVESAEAALAALDRWISTGSWTKAERLLSALKDRPPAWAEGTATDIKVREVQIRLGLDQRPVALAALKEIVIKSGAPRAAAFKLVRDYAAAGEQTTATLLAREIVRLLPGDAAAEKLLKEAQTPLPPKE